MVLFFSFNKCYLPIFASPRSIWVVTYIFLLVVFAIYFQHDSTIYKTRELHHGRSNSFKGKKELLTTPRGVHSLLYIAYTCVWDLFIGGLFTLQKIL